MSPLLEFRKNTALTTQMSEVLALPVVAEWLRRAQEANEPEALPVACDPICSVRLHSEMVGKNFLLKQLQLAGTPLPVEEQEEEATYEEP